MNCEFVTEITPAQQRQLGIVEERVRRVLRSLHATNPNDPVWKVVGREWNGRVLLGSRLHEAEYDRTKGCLRVGMDDRGSEDHVPKLTARCLLALIKTSTTDKRCTEDMLRALEHAEQMGVPISVSCEDIKANGMVASPYYRRYGCDTDGQDGRQWTFPELIGRNVDDAMQMLRRGYPDLHIEARTWDMIPVGSQHTGNPPERSVVVVYDPWTRKVVFPEPHLASIEMQTGLTQNCFMLADDQTCVGAPRRVPEAWKALIGRRVGDATNSLRFEYPHALVETQPNTAPVHPEARRRDRIRVLFDPSTARTTHIMLG